MKRNLVLGILRMRDLRKADKARMPAFAGIKIDGDCGPSTALRMLTNGLAVLDSVNHRLHGLRGFFVGKWG